jgi:hypothetical protein
MVMPFDGFHELKGMAQKDLLETVREQLNSKFRKERMHGFTDRYLDELQVFRSLRQEDMGLVMTRVYLGEPISLSKIHPTRKVAELHFNLDELSSAE